MLFKDFTKLSVVFLVVISLLIINPTPQAVGEALDADRGDIIIPPSKTLGDPAYDSGWEGLGISPDPIPVNFDHNLGGDPKDYLVDLVCKDETYGVYDCTSNDFAAHAHWYDLTSSSISVYASTFIADAVRVRIYKLVPAFDSDWKENTPWSWVPLPEDIDIKHNLGDNPRGYLVDLECKNDSVLGIYDCIDNSFNVNAQWHALTDTSVVARVSASLPDDVRVRIYQLDQPPQPDPAYYDSGLEVIGFRPDPLPMVFDHNLGGDIDNYFVDLECSCGGDLGVYNCSDLNFNINAHWYDLTETSIWVHVGGLLPDRIRVRIWRGPEKLYLPLILSQ